jgi:hypothetical protein
LLVQQMCPSMAETYRLWIILAKEGFEPELSQRWQPDTSTTPLPMRYASMGYTSMGFTSMGYTSTGHLKF